MEHSHASRVATHSSSVYGSCGRRMEEFGQERAGQLYHRISSALHALQMRAALEGKAVCYRRLRSRMGVSQGLHEARRSGAGSRPDRLHAFPTNAKTPVSGEHLEVVTSFIS